MSPISLVADENPVWSKTKPTGNAPKKTEHRIDVLEQTVREQKMELEKLRRLFRSSEKPVFTESATIPQKFVLPEIEKSQNKDRNNDEAARISITTPIDHVFLQDDRWEQIASWWDRIDLYGQLRFRQETDWERNNLPTRNRQRLRLRLGGLLEFNSEIAVGARMTTGDRKRNLEPEDRQGAPLSYQDTGDVFDKFEFNLDRLFFQLTPDWFPENTTLWLGKFKMPMYLNPIFRGPVGDLVWDEAAHPEGAALTKSWNDVMGFDSLYVAGGISAVLEVGNNDEASLWYSQVWVTRNVGNNFLLEGGVSYFHWNNLNADGNTSLSFQNNFGNAVKQVGPNEQDVEFLSEFRVIDSLLAVTYGKDGNSRLGYPLRAVWETIYNDGAVHKDQNFGYSIGMDYGPGIDGRTAGDWYFYYTWNRVEQDAVFTPVSQDDFIRTTNFRGQMFGYLVYLWENVDMRISFLSDTPIGTNDTEWRGRIDLTATW